MFSFFFRAPAFQLVLQADLMTKIVLFCLFSLSVFCFWIVICKLLALKKQRKAMEQLRHEIARTESFDQLLEVSKAFQKSVHRDTAGGRFLILALKELKKSLSAHSIDGKKPNFEALQLMLDQSLDHVLAEEEQYMPVLGTAAAVSPLIGLFGTVWGLVHAFMNISQSKSADISVVAPGIAEALITTLGGLAVAIPTLIFFHFFSNEIRKLEIQLVTISDRFLSVVKQTLRAS